ncbi:MAG: DUF305 domain-containing protein, partial [Aldersonia sp.]|nr:DUF305 domain-containing protein [Aldersonia sp.]
MAPESNSAWRRRVALAAVGVVLVAVGVALGAWWQREPAESGVTLSPTDIGFAQDMSAHHAQAVLLSQTLPRGVDPLVRALADQIVAAQSAEIATMQGWLTLVGAPLTAEHPMAWMGADAHAGHAVGHDGGDASTGPPMPGMASVDEISKLAGMGGRDAEVWYLQLMIRHHNGGIDMVEAGYNQGLSEPVARTALGMVRDQGNETGVMTAML